jgi:hypothetical protein
LYASWLRLTKERPEVIEALLEIHDTQISINRFERICTNTGYTIVDRRLYLLNPIYRYKFGRTPRIQFSFIAALPVLRDFVTTGVYYILKRT